MTLTQIIRTRLWVLNIQIRVIVRIFPHATNLILLEKGVLGVIRKFRVASVLLVTVMVFPGQALFPHVYLLAVPAVQNPPTPNAGKEK